MILTMTGWKKNAKTWNGEIFNPGLHGFFLCISCVSWINASTPSLSPTSHLAHFRYNYQLTFITAVKIATKTQRHKVTPRILIKKIPWCLGAFVAKN